MQSGRLNQRISIQRNDGVEDDAGQIVDSWTNTLTHEPAEVIETGGAEQVYGKSIDATATHLVRIRYRPTLTLDETYQITWGTRLLGITNARDPDGRRRELWITCREVK